MVKYGEKLGFSSHSHTHTHTQVHIHTYFHFTSLKILFHIATAAGALSHCYRCCSFTLLQIHIATGAFYIDVMFQCNKSVTMVNLPHFFLAISMTYQNLPLGFLRTLDIAKT